jgi:hypothetical protein
VRLGHRLALILLLTVDLSVLFCLLAPFHSVSAKIDPGEVTHVEGRAFKVVLRERVRFPRTLSADSTAGLHSSLTLYEGERPLIGAHSLYRDIADLGGGRFVHWRAGREATLYFSSLDGTDPRRNGRIYRWEGRAAFDRWIVIAGLLLVLVQVSIGVALITASVGEAGATASAVALLLLVAGCLQWLVMDSDRPRVLSMSDPGMVAGMVASSLRPERFLGDPALGPGTSHAFYATVLRPVVSAIDVWVSDLGTSYLLLYGPLALVQGLGFLALGIFVLSSRWHALLLALLTLPPVYTNGGDLWGLADEPLTRMLYGAALPFLLLAFLRWYEKRLAFVWLPVLLAATVYLHPVSQPSVAFSCLLGAMMAEEQGAFRKRLGRTVAAGLILVAFMIPYVVVYFSSGVGRMDDVIGTALEGTERRRLLEGYFGPMYYDVRLAVTALAKGGTGSGQGPWGWRWVVWIGGFVTLVTFAASRGTYRRPARFLCYFLVGIVASSVGVCAVDQFLAARSARLPAAIDLVRNTRFLIPTLLIGAVLAFDGVAALQRRVLGARVGTACLVILTATWWYWQPTLIVKRLQARLGLSAPATPGAGHDASDILAVARTLPEGSLFLPIGCDTVGLALRYGAFQPVAFLNKDLNLMLYGGSGDLRDWLDTRHSMSRFEASRETLEARSLLRSLIARTRVHLLLVRQSSLTPEGRAAIADAGPVVAARGDWTIVSVATPPALASK